MSGLEVIGWIIGIVVVLKIWIAYNLDFSVYDDVDSEPDVCHHDRMYDDVQ